MAFTIVILSTRDIIDPDTGNVSGRHADISISDGVDTYLLGVGGLPATGDLQPILDARTAELWPLAVANGVRSSSVRDVAKALLDKQGEQTSALIRAVVLAALDNDNAIAQKHNDLLTWLGTQTTLTNRNQLPAMAALQPTAVQARNAIKAKIDAGGADV